MTRTTLSLSLALALGCSASQPAPVSTTPAPAPTSRADASTNAPDATPDAAPPAPTVTARAELSASDAQAVVDAWVRAQNGGDFAAYQALYAQRFTGVKRAGPRVTRFDRAGWMTDRGVMFRSAMSVAMRDVTVSTGPDGATVRFTQDFSQGRFHDTGPKVIELVREGGALRIAREEMLASSLVAGPNTPAAPTPGTLMPIFSYGDRRFVMLAAAPDDGSWATGDATLVSRATQDVVTRRAVRVEALPEALRALDGVAIRTYHAEGAGCEATLGARAILGRVDVHFGVEQMWQGEQPDGTHGAPASDAQVASDAWAQSEGGYALVAELDGSCGDGALWARVAAMPEAPRFVESDAPAVMMRAALARVRALPAWTALQRDYRANGGTSTAWDSHASSSLPQVHVWQVEGSPRRFVVVQMRTAVGGCAEFSGALTVVFEANAAGALTLRSDGTNPGSFEPTAATDLDGDGVPEFLTEHGYVRTVGTVFREVSAWVVPSHDCDC